MTLRVANSEYTCPVEVDLACCTTLDEAFNSGDPERVSVAQRCLDAAWEILWSLSGRQFYLCPMVVRPCRVECCDECSISGPRWTPALIGGEWTNVSCSRCGDSCSCTEVSEVRLPGPIYSVTQVLLDGEILPPTSYRVDNEYFLVRTDGGRWPTCQNMAADATEEGTWEVTYTRGRPIPAGGEAALSELACELCKACVGDKSCCLPSRVTSVSRQGVSFAVLDPMTFLKDGMTGIYLVDLWLRSVNPYGLMRRATFLSPDMPNPRRTTWP